MLRVFVILTMVFALAIGLFGCNTPQNQQASQGGKQTVTQSSQANQNQSKSTEPLSTKKGYSRNNPLPIGQSLTTTNGFEITVKGMVQGQDAWDIVSKANMFNDEAYEGNKYVLVSAKVKNVNSQKEPASVDLSDFKLVGSSNRIFNISDQSVVLPETGPYKELSASLYHNGEITGGIHFSVPIDENSLVLIWDKPSNEQDKRFFEVK